jgi:hypothetical protein
LSKQQAVVDNLTRYRMPTSDFTHSNVYTTTSSTAGTTYLNAPGGAKTFTSADLGSIVRPR